MNFLRSFLRGPQPKNKNNSREHEASQEVNSQPIVKSLDYDSCRIYCPQSDKYLTFVITIPDEFLTSDKTIEDWKEYGVELKIIPPNKEEGEQVLVASRETKKYGVLEEEFSEAMKVAILAFLEQWK